MTDPSVHPGGKAPHLLEVSDLRVSYGGSVRALHGVSLAVAEGSIVAVLGNNGAGKSTLLRAVSGTLALEGGRIDGGSITLRGRRLSRDPAAIVRAGIVQVPEGRRIFGELSVDENLRAAGLAARSRGARAAARDHVYDLFPVLAERRSQRAALLSGGEQQMLAIARALMTRPRLLLLDEPSLGLAPRVVGLISEVVQEINREGTSIVIVEQNAAMALELADSAYVLDVGRVSLHGPAAELARSGEVQDRYLGVAGRDSRAAAPPAVPPSQRRGESTELRIEGLSVRFGGLRALSDVSFTVQPGTIHALIGPNGAGKTTCLNVLTGVYPVVSGSARLGEAELTRLKPHQIAKLGVGRTFQNISLSPHATVAANLMLGRHRLTRSGFVSTGLQLPWAIVEGRRQEERIREIARLVGLGDRLGARVHHLPYGDRKRVELGRALCAEPVLLLLDEPVAGMNVLESREMAQTIARVQEELGISIVLVEHDMAFVMGLAKTVTVLDFGRLVAEGPPKAVQRDPAVIRAYLGSKEDSSLAQEAVERAQEVSP